MTRPLGRLPTASLTASRAEDIGISCVIQSQGEDPNSALANDPEAGLGIAADVRLDNRDAIAAELGIADRKSHLSDASLILEGYRTWGLGIAASILAEGVFLLWDGRRRQLVCWRDVAGSRPLYYTEMGGQGAVISSDLRSLVAHPGVDGRLDLAYTSALLRNGPIFQRPDRTLCDGVLKLPAAHILIVDAQGPRSEPYWTPGDAAERRYTNTGDYVDELKTLLHQAVDTRLRDGSKVIASHLSGGLDSSSVAVLANRAASQHGRSLIGLSWAPPRDLLPPIENDERPLVDAVANAEGIKTRYSRLRGSDLIDHDTRDLALRPTTTLHFELGASQSAAKEGARTILSGWGGDELVVNNGKGYFADLARRGRWLTLQRELRMRTGIHESSMLSLVRGRVVKPLVSDRLLYRIRPDEKPVRHSLPACLRREFAVELEKIEPLDWPVLRERPGVRQFQTAKFLHGHLQYRMEAWAAHGTDIGIKYAYPLLDKRLIEFALSVPDHLYFKDGWKRWLYRTAMKGVLPDDVRWHPHKQDHAMSVQAYKVRDASREAWHQALRSRRENPFVDTERYLKAANTDTSANLTARAPDSHAMWMPFASLSAP